jgi:DNA-binding NtrC family response regulator
MPGLALATRNSVLLVSDHIEDRAYLKSIFQDSRWELLEASALRDALEKMRRTRCEIPVVICERDLPDGDWKRLLSELDDMAVRPSVIVCARLADERLWAEVLNLGGFDLLLSAPFRAEEVLRVTQSAWSAWNRTAQPVAGAKGLAAESHG